MTAEIDASLHDSGLDLPAHEATYAEFVELTKIVIVVVLGHVLLLVLWGLEGYGWLALVGLILLDGAAFIGGLTGLGWKAVGPVFALIGLACILF